MPYTFHRPANGQTYTVAVPDDLYQLGMSDQFARQMVECVGLLISEAHIAGQGSMKPMLEEMQRTLAERTAERDLSSAAHKADIARIGEVMMEAAVENGFCEVFDYYVDHLNDHLAYKLPTRKSDYIVRRTYMVTTEERVRCQDEVVALEDADTLTERDFSHGRGAYLPITQVHLGEEVVLDAD